MTDALGMKETFGYDKNGRMTDKWDRDGYHTSYSYNSRGLITAILYDDGNSVAYSYDALRRLKEVRDGCGSARITSDALGRVISVTDRAGNTVGYEWGSMNEKLRLTYPDGKEAAYSYNDKGQLTSLSTGSGTITYSYDMLGHLKEKAFPNGTVTEYDYNGMGMPEKIRHAGSGFEEEYSYRYDRAGNKTEVSRRRQGIEEDSGIFGYGYDALNRLTEVSRNGRLLRRYAYDAFGNRTVKEDYSGQEPSQTRYHYNANNQLISLADGGAEQTYVYDRRGNLTAVSRGEELWKSFTFDAANRMTGAAQTAEGIEKRAEYSYDAFGNRTGQTIYSMETDSGIPDAGRKKPQNPECQIRYTIDLTRQYYNLLMTEDSASKKEQTFYWDGNVAAMEEAGHDSYYMQDDLGSPMLFTGEEGGIREKYGYDEFGQSLFAYPESRMQPFGFTGYQMEEAGGVYFAQARRYDAGAGRFISEDIVPGFMAAPHTMNHYSYCWNQPMEHVDLNGKIACGIVGLMALGIGIIVGAAVYNAIKQSDSIRYPMPEPSNHEYKYTADIYNSPEYVMRTNCYAYALDIVDNPVNGGVLYSREDSYYSLGEFTFAAQPGLFSGQYSRYNDIIVSGTEEGNQKLVELVKADTKAMGLNFREYEYDMSGGYAVLLVVDPYEDYHWYRQEADGTWSHKRGTNRVINGVMNPIQDAKKLGYTNIVGYYYITEVCDVD